MNALHAAALWLARPAIVFYSLPALMILLVAGTLAQAELGLYEAHQRYFSSLLVWVGPEDFIQLPLPGGYLLIGLLTLNLFIKFVFFSEWRWRKAGIILAHLGALTLLIGGLATALSAREGYMAIPEGQESPFVYDYHQRTLVIFKNQELLFKADFENLTPGQALQVEDLPFTLTVLNSCVNCDILKREDTPQLFVRGELRDLAAFMALSRKPPEAENERNLSGITFNLSGLAEEQNGTYIAFEAMPRPIEIAHGSDTYALLLGKEQRALPFSIALKDFKKEDYPGSRMARAYSSAVTVKDGAAEWDALIEMNKPLRYKGYTFYQSSFEQTPDTEVTVLSVVENKGRIFPYIGTIIMAAGLILHLALALRRAT